MLAASDPVAVTHFYLGTTTEFYLLPSLHQISKISLIPNTSSFARQIWPGLQNFWRSGHITVWNNGHILVDSDKETVPIDLFGISPWKCESWLLAMTCTAQVWFPGKNSILQPHVQTISSAQQSNGYPWTLSRGKVDNVKPTIHHLILKPQTQTYISYAP
jgi:hypothetical protein